MEFKIFTVVAPFPRKFPAEEMEKLTFGGWYSSDAFYLLSTCRQNDPSTLGKIIIRVQVPARDRNFERKYNGVSFLFFSFFLSFFPFSNERKRKSRC